MLKQRTFIDQKDNIKRVENAAHRMENHIYNVYLTNNSFPEFVENVYKSIRKRQKPNKTGKNVDRHSTKYEI